MPCEIKLRAPEPEDIDLIYIWENSSDEAHSSLRTGPISRYKIKEYVENYDGEIYTLGSLRFMIEYDGQKVGTADVFDFDHRARHAFIGIYISPAFRRKGIAASAIKEVERQMKKKVGMYCLTALVAEDNIPSRSLFEKSGYKTAGKLQGWLTDGHQRLNALIYQHIL